MSIKCEHGSFANIKNGNTKTRINTLIFQTDTEIQKLLMVQEPTLFGTEITLHLKQTVIIIQQMCFSEEETS